MELDFKDFLSYESYKEVAELSALEQSKETPDYKKIFEKEEVLQKALLNYLKKRAEMGLLEMPMNSNTHYSNTLSHWKNLVEGKLKKNEEDQIIYLFSKVLSYNLLGVKEISEESFLKGYESLTNKINEGSFQRYDLEGENKCFGCEQRMLFMSKDWKFKLFDVEYKENFKAEFKPIKDCIEDKLFEVNVEFKTGELLMADWFRIQEFTEKVEYDPDYTKISINSDLGQVKSTEHAASLGFVTIHVGNSSPRIFQQGENFIFGHEDEEKPQKQYEEKGYVCTDLWNVTVIDKSRLIEIVSEKLGLEKATQTVEKYLKENKSNINFINVQPGKYNIGFYPRKSINKYDTELPNDIETTFYMKKELPKKKLKM